MKAFLIVNIVLCCITIVIRAVFLCVDDYPRKTEFSACNDVVGSILSFGFIGWAIYLLTQLG